MSIGRGRLTELAWLEKYLLSNGLLLCAIVDLFFPPGLIMFGGSRRPQVSSGRVGRHRAKITLGELNKMTAMAHGGAKARTTRLSGHAHVVDDIAWAENRVAPRKKKGRSILVVTGSPLYFLGGQLVKVNWRCVSVLFSLESLSRYLSIRSFGRSCDLVSTGKPSRCQKRALVHFAGRVSQQFQKLEWRLFFLGRWV